MTGDSALTMVRYWLIVDELDESGESTICSSVAYLRVNVFPSTEPFSQWSDADRMRIAIEDAHRLPMSDVDRALERLTPIWWTGDRPEDIDWGTTPEGEALFERWLHQPPTEISL